MATVIPIDQHKKKKALPTNRAVPFGNILRQESPELRNKSIGYDPEMDRALADAALEKLIKNSEISELNQQGTNNQREVLQQIQTEFKAGNFFDALTRI